MQDIELSFKSRVANISLRYGVFCIYVALGMVIIVAIERTDIDETSRKAKLLSDLQANITTKYNLSRREFETLANAIYDAKSPAPMKWTYGQGFSFTIHLVTTIGYGNITPVTDGGKIFCIFYALFGIPITVLMLSTVGEEMLNFEKYIIKTIEIRLLKRQNVAHSCRMKCFITVFVTILLLIMIGSAITTGKHGDWTYVDSVYCWFITFTTVGFGDYIPGHASGKGFSDGMVILFGIYILLGLCAMSNLLNIIGEFASLGIFQIQFHSNTDCERKTRREDNKDNNKDTPTNNRTDSDMETKSKEDQQNAKIDVSSV